jgi:hypothetical protein
MCVTYLNKNNAQRYTVYWETKQRVRRLIICWLGIAQVTIQLAWLTYGQKFVGVRKGTDVEGRGRVSLRGEGREIHRLNNPAVAR